MILVFTVGVVALLIGAAGGFVFRGHVKQKWCPDCGAGLRCIPCAVKNQQRVESQQPVAGSR